MSKSDLETAALDRMRLLRWKPAPAELRRLRESAGLSKLALAKLLDTSHLAVARWESGVVGKGAPYERYLAFLRKVEGVLQEAE